MKPSKRQGGFELYSVDHEGRFLASDKDMDHTGYAVLDRGGYYHGTVESTDAEKVAMDGEVALYAPRGELPRRVEPVAGRTVPATRGGGGVYPSLSAALERIRVGRPRKSNPQAHYHVPSETVLLGTVLDLVLEDFDGERRLKIDEWDGWLMVTTPAGMDASPGRARLYLLSTGGDAGDAEPGGSARARDTFDRWHRRAPEQTRVIAVPDEIGYQQGRVRRIGYASDKWGRRGDVEEYEHDFRDGGLPLLYTDTEFLDDATAALLVGGDMRVTEGGID